MGGTVQDSVIEEARVLDRREALKTIILISLGVGVALLSSTSLLGLFRNPSSKSSLGSQAQTSKSVATGITQSQLETTSENGSYFTVKVVYFGMATQATGVKQEYFALQSPASLSNLLTQIKQEHAVAGPMLTTMQIMINGNPAVASQRLFANDEIGFIPILGGG
ncbi:MAG TPA: MoaD/ThiS family protein [Nitrososphaerales archaeon]|nr:MoaD/ThiS family protein [Nitrososphaerales archaeon]